MNRRTAESAGGGQNIEVKNFSDQWGSAYNILMPSLPQDVGIGQRTFVG